MSTKAYKQAIETLMSRDVDIDYCAVVVKLAQHSPTLFNQLYAELTKAPKVDTCPISAHNIGGVVTALNHMRFHNAKVETLKEIRRIYGFSLKEAKDVADHLANYLSNAGYSVAEYPDPALSAAQRQALDQLIWAEKNY